MARDNSGLHPNQYACKCLNIRIVASEPPSDPPEYPGDEKYTPVFVEDDGISVTHPQVTVRVASKAEPISGTSRYSRFMAVTCLLCSLPVYRVHQTISLEIEGNVSTLLPTEEWVEQETLKTATGWIDVHKDSLVGENISKAESSSSYASYFSLLLPPSPSPAPSSEEEIIPVERKTPPEEPTPAYLSDLPPLFLPPPFTPSHPIFVHLAGIASQQSQKLRASAEQRISDFVKAETAGIEIKERELKTEVETLWTKFKQHISAVQQERSQSTNLARSPSRVKDSDKFSANGVASSSRSSSSVMIRSFVPQVVSPAPLALSESLPRVSALSASLATSTFYHPRETRLESSSAKEQHGSSPSTLSSTSRSGSSTLVHPITRTAGVSVREFKPNINDDINTQASYKYFIDLEEDMARYRRAQEATKQPQEVIQDAQRAGTSKISSSSSPNGTPESNKLETEESRSLSAERSLNADEETTPSRGRDKGKRKVTFDVEPNASNAHSDGESTEGEATGQSESREMIFPLEDLDSLENKAEGSNERQSTLPLLEQSASRPQRPRTSRPNAGLEAFAALRPTSLPNPSHIRPLRSQPGVDSSSQGMLMSRVAANAARNEASSSRTASTSSTPMNEYDATILKLVAADTPSHRGAWTPESKAWQAFTRRKDSKDSLPLKKITNIPEDAEATTSKSESDATVKPTATKPRVQFATKLRVLQYEADEKDDDFDYLKSRGMPGSMPISILKAKEKEPLSLASYVTPATMAEQTQATVSPSPGSASKPLSSAAIRKAMYAERDRNRAMDPGALDFAVEEDEDGEEEAEDDGETDRTTTDIPDGEKARKQALRILQARSTVPEEGMWRSLA